MAKRATPELKAAIRRYHRDGWSYYALAQAVPYSEVTIAKWCDEDLRARQRQSSSEWSTCNREYHRTKTAEWNRLNADYVKAKRKERYAREKAANPNLNKENHARYRANRNAQS